MMKTMLRAAAAAAILLLPAAAAAQQPVKLRFASTIPADSVSTGAVFMPFIEAVKKESQGAVEIELFSNGALGRNMTAQAQMITDGVADIAFVVVPQQRGRFRETEVLELPALFGNVTDASTVASRMMIKNTFQGFEEFHVIGLFGTGPTSIHSRGAIASLDDIKGKKIRAGGALESQTITALGGVPVALTVPEVIEAVSRGNVDGVTSLASILFDFGFASVTNTHYFARLGNLPMAILMSKQKFDSLPKAGQDAIRKYSGEYIEKLFVAANARADEAVLKRLQDDPKRKVVIPSDAEVARTKQMVLPVIDAWKKQNPRNEQLYQAVEQELAGLRASR